MSTSAGLNLMSEFKQALGGTDTKWIMASSSASHEQAIGIKATDPKRLVIACQGQHGSTAAEHSPGLELVLWLRLEHKVTCPILLVGFLSEERVRSSRTECTERFLIHAPGIRYAQLPVPKEEWPELKDWLDKSSITEKDIDKEYPPYLRAGFDIGSFRHALANKFGLKATWDIHFAATAGNKAKYPAELQTCLDQEKDLLIAQALHPLEEGLVGQAITNLRSSVKKSGERVVVPSGLKTLHVDDEIDLGWGQLVRRMLNAPEPPMSNYRPYQPTGVDEVSIAAAVLDNIREHVPSVVLLDLRLTKEDENIYRSDAPPSGIAVLRAIRAAHKTLPVIVTSASNKLWNYRMVVHEGADGYWMKQGLELGWGAKETLDSYLDLCHMLASVAESALLQAIRKLESTIQWMSDPARQWWTQGYWRTRERRIGDTESSQFFLWMAISDAQHYCRRYVFARGTKPSREERAMALASVCIKIGSAAECIVAHDLGDRERDRRIERCESSSLRDLFWIRNEAAHSRALDNINEELVIRQMNKFDDFIINGCL